MTGSDCAQLDNLAAPLALGALDAEEAAFVRAHLRACRHAHPAALGALTVAAAIGSAVPDEDHPEPALRARVLAAIHDEPFISPLPTSPVVIAPPAVARGADAYFMDGEGTATAANFMLVVENDASGAVLLMSGLPVLPDGETYELWVEQDGAVVGVGTFRADDRGLAAVAIDASLRGIRQAMVTVEPAGGSSQPSAGEVVMRGDLSL